MIIGETILVVSAICSAMPPRRASIQNYSITSNAPGCFQIASGITIEDEVTYNLNSLPGIGGAATLANRRRCLLMVDIDVAKFDRDTRRSIYAAGRALHEEFPNHVLDFRLIDKSQVAIGDALTV